MRKLTMSLAVLTGLAAVIFTLPLRWIAPLVIGQDISDNLNYGGTIWTGYAALPDNQGYMDLSVNLIDGLTGNGLMQFETRGTSFVATGALGVADVKNVRMKAPVQALTMRDARLYGLSGEVDITLKTLTYRSPCTAEGKILVRGVTMNYPDWVWQGPDLSGPISCQGDVLIFDMTGQGGGDGISLTLGLHKGGRYDINLAFTTQQAGADIALPLLGFDAQNGRWQLTERGQWSP